MEAIFLFVLNDINGYNYKYYYRNVARIKYISAMLPSPNVSFYNC